MTDPHPIHCDDCQQRLQEFALDELTGDVRDQVAGHLADGCPSCNTQLAQIVADFAALAHTLPTQTTPSHIERDLIRRIAGQSYATPAANEKLPKKSLTRGLIGLAALAAGLAGLAAWNTWQSESVLTNVDQWAELQRRVDEAEVAQHFSAVPQLNFVSLRGPAPDKPVHGYVVTDNVTRQWHVFIFNLPKLPADRMYQLWFVTGDDRHIPARVATLDDNGNLTQLVDLPSDLPQITGLAISDEPAAGAPEPTGEHFFQANLP